jgi:hypothetical protein
VVKEVKWPELATYELKPYFWLAEPAAEVIFRAPVGGATTPNSVNPRSELRQMLGNGEPAAWNNQYATLKLTCRLRFRQIPTSSDATRGVVAMQVHDGNDDVSVLRLEKNGDLWVTNGDTSHYELVNSSYALMTWMVVRLEARKGGDFYWYINDMTTPVASVDGPRSGCYFKAGAYTQATPSNSTGYGEVGFSSIKIDYIR